MGVSFRIASGNLKSLMAQNIEEMYMGNVNLTWVPLISFDPSVVKGQKDPREYCSTSLVYEAQNVDA